MKKLLPLLLVPVALIGIAATYTITQLTANLNPGNGTLIEVYDPAASPKSGKVLLTNYVKQSQITFLSNAVVNPNGPVIGGDIAMFADVSGTNLAAAVNGLQYIAPWSNGELNDLKTGSLTVTNASTLNGGADITGTVNVTGDMNVTGTLTNATTQTDTLYLSSLTETNKLLGLGATTNAMLATAAMITNTWGIFDGTTTKFVAGNGTLQTPAGGAAIVGTVSNAVASAGLLAVDSTKTNGIAATFTHVESALLNTADGLPTDYGARLVTSYDGSLFWATPRNYIELIDEFSGDGVASVPQSQMLWLRTVTSGGFCGPWASLLAGMKMGAWSIGAGTAAGGNASLRQTGTTMYFEGDGAIYWEARVRLEDLSDGTDTFEVMLGWTDNTLTTTNVTDGVYFRYLNGFNEGKWTGCTQNNTALTTNVVWGGTTAADTWYRLGILVAADAANVKFYIDGTPVATNDSNIPITSARLTMPTMFTYKHAGTNQRYTHLDYCRIYQWLSSNR